MTDQPLPRQPWETDANYQARIAAWEGSVTTRKSGHDVRDAQEKRTGGNRSSTSAQPIKENEMSTTDTTALADTRTIRQPIEQVDKTVIDELIGDLDELEEGHYGKLDESNPLYTPPADILIVPASTVRDPARGRDAGEKFLLADVYDLNGRRIPLSERPKGWLRQQKKIRKPGPNMYDQNVAYRLGDDYIVIGRGQFSLVGETTVDRERAFEVISPNEESRRGRAKEERDFLDANPIIEASQPWWADAVDVSQGDRLGEVEIGYSLSIGVDDLYLRQDATLQSGKFTLDEIEFQNGYRSIPITEWATVAGGLRGLADALDRLAEEGR